VLSSKRAQVAITRFYGHTYAIMAALFVAHLVFFAVFITFLDRQRAYVYETDAAGRASNNAYRWVLQTKSPYKVPFPRDGCPPVCQHSRASCHAMAALRACMASLLMAI
jgi:hypothetical protein